MEGISPKNKNNDNIVFQKNRRYLSLFWISLLIGLMSLFVVEAVFGFPSPTDAEANALLNTSIDSLAQNISAKSTSSQNDSSMANLNSAPNGGTSGDSSASVEGELCDNEPPFWSEHIPAHQSTGVAHTRNFIKFKLRDQVSGVDLNTFHLVVDGVDIYQNSPGLTLTGNPRYYIVTYELQPGHYFHWGDTIWIKLDVCDTWEEPNCMKDSIYFVIESDVVAPVINPIYPLNNDTNVSINTPIRLEIVDDNSGINIETFRISINGLSVQPDSFAYGKFRSIVVINSIQDSLLNYNQLINVQASVEDSAKNVGTANYAFETEQESYPPRIEFVYPKKDTAAFISSSDSLVFKITDNMSGVDQATTQIDLKLNDQQCDFDILSINQISPNGFLYTIKPKQTLQHSDRLKLTITAYDLSGNMAQDSNSFPVLEDFYAPKLVMISPQPLFDVPPYHEIKFNLIDVISGVDFSTIEFFVNGTAVPLPAANTNGKPMVTGDSSKYTISYPYFEPWNSTVQLQVKALDFVSNPLDTLVEYSILKDLQGPRIALISPKQRKDVAPNHEIQLDVIDSLAGINSNSIELFVNGNAITDFDLTGDSAKYTVIYNHQAEWGSAVNVQIKAADLAQNSTDSLYAYSILDDPEKPLVTLLNPTSKVDVPPTHEIKIDIADSLSGVDSSSIQLIINGNPIPDFSLIGDSSKFTLSYLHSAPWGFQVAVRLIASDLATNRVDTTFTYKTLPDSDEGPIINLVKPTPRENVTPNHEILLEVLDQKSGVDSASITVQINGTPVSNYQISGNPSKYLVSYQHLAPWNSSVDLAVSATDLATNRTDSLFNYSITEDYVKPLISNIKPQAGDSVAPAHQIKFDVTDNLSGVDSTTIKLTVNGTLIPDFTITGDSSKYTITYNNSARWNSNVKVDIEVADYAKNVADTTINYSTFQEDDKPVITLISPKPLVNVNPAHEIKFEVSDQTAGIDSSKIELIIDGNSISHSDYAVNGDSAKYTVTYNHFALWNTSVELVIKATDFARNSADSTFNYSITTDLVGPDIVLINPDSTTNLPLDTEIKYQISDDTSGVDPNSIKLWVNGTETSASTELQPDGSYILTYASDAFQYKEKLKLIVQAADNAGNSNSRTDEFEFVNDVTGPIVTALIPLPNDTVKKTTPIKFQVMDSLAGINYASLILKINGQPIDSTKITIEKIKPDRLAHFNYLPDVPFIYGDTVTVNIQIQDKVGNAATGDTDYQFFIEEDLIAPIITIIRPDSNAIDVARDSQIVFEVCDSLSGIDTTSIQLGVNNQWISDPQITAKDDFCYQVVYSPNPLFNFNDTVYVDIAVKDKARNPNESSLSYHFYITRDDEKPQFVNLIPAPNAKNVPSRTTIHLEITDNLSGVDTTTFTMKVNNWPVADDSIKISGADSTHYLVDYTPNNPFFPGQLVNVELNVKDLVGNAAFLPYSFEIDTTESQPDVPIITPIYPVENDSGVPINTQFTIEAEDRSGIDTTSAEFVLTRNRVDTTFAEPSDIQFLDGLKKVRFVYNSQRDTLFNYNLDTVSVQFSIKDLSYFQTSATKIYSFKVQEDTTGPILKRVLPSRLVNVSHNTPIMIDVLDPETGINADSLELKVNGNAVAFDTQDMKAKHLRMLFNMNKNTLFTAGDSISVFVKAKNKVNIDNTLAFTFVVIDDTTNPMIVYEQPVTPAERNSSIVFRLLDYESGINLDKTTFTIDSISTQKIFVDSINDKNITKYDLRVKPLQGMNEYQITYNITNELIFDYFQHVKVHIYTENFSGNPKYRWAELDTGFQVISGDTIPPTITPITPADQDTSIAISPEFHLEIIDNLTGVDTNTVKLYWKYAYETQPHKIDSIHFIFNGDTLIVNDPDLVFTFDTNVYMTCLACDLAGNCGKKDYHFRTKRYDEEAPWLVLVDPDSNYVKDIDNYQLSRDHEVFTFDLLDNTSELALDSIKVHIFIDSSGYNGPLSFYHWTFVSGEGNGYKFEKIESSEDKKEARVTCRLPDDFTGFSYNDILKMEVTAYDVYNNRLNTTVTFHVIKDTKRPEFSTIPAPQERNVPLDTPIEITLRDDKAGVVVNTIEVRMIINDFFQMQEPDSTDWENNAIILFPEGKMIQDRGNLQNILPELILKMQGEKTLFNFNQTVWLWIFAEDNAGINPNKLDTTIYFETEQRYSDIKVLGLNYPQQKYCVYDSVKVTALLTNDFMDINQEFEVSFRIEGEENSVVVKVLPSLLIGQKDTVDAVLHLFKQGSHRIQVYADEINLIREEDDYKNNTRSIMINVGDGKIYVKSNPFTPNGDGINDYAKFDCKEFKLEYPLIKLFDLRGRFIQELTEMNNEQKFQWDGRDKNGNEVMPGVYLFILQDKGEAVTNGFVVVAR